MPRMILYPFFVCLLTLSNIAMAEVREDFSYKWYSVFHKPGMSLKKALSISTPIRGDDGKKFRGNMRWHIKWQFQTATDESGQCRITDNLTDLTLVMTIPGIITSDNDVKARFEQYVERLKFHEMGHADIARKGADQIDKGILSLPPMASCQQVNQAANSLGNSVLHRVSQESEKYDKVTKHGKTQGVYLN